MEFLAFIAPAVQIFRCVSPSIGSRFDNFVGYKKNMENLQSKVDDLKNLREDIQSKVDAAERNLESISQVVRSWLEKVDSETNKDIETMVSLRESETMEMINIKGWRGWRFSRSRYNVGKEAQKKLIIILDLLTEGHHFNDVTIPSPLSSLDLIEPENNNITDHVSNPPPPRPSLPNQVNINPPENIKNYISNNPTSGSSVLPPPPPRPSLPEKGNVSPPRRNIITYVPNTQRRVALPPRPLRRIRNKSTKTTDQGDNPIPFPPAQKMTSELKSKEHIIEPVMDTVPNTTRPPASQPSTRPPASQPRFHLIPEKETKTLADQGDISIPFPPPPPPKKKTSEVKSREHIMEPVMDTVPNTTRPPASQPRYHLIPEKETKTLADQGDISIPFPPPPPPKKKTSEVKSREHIMEPVMDTVPNTTRPPASQPRYHLIPEKETKTLADQGDISIPFPPPPPPKKKTSEVKSREHIMESVIYALKEEETCLVGVYGIGGAGKTMLMKQVCQRVKTHKMFDEIIVITVSKMTDLSASDVELKRIQGEIAMSLKYIRLEELDDVQKRGVLLCRRLKNEERVLIILDDIWTTEILNLSDVGIPCGQNYHKGCKVVFTTRSLEVCNLLNSQRNIEVEMLSEKDSWQLFKENIGDLAVSRAPETVAKLVKECGGLPLVLVTVGRALRNKDVHVLNAAALKLQKSSYFGAKRDGKIKSKVYYSIKLSYDQLEDQTLKTYFLFCSCFPEDYRISTNELMMHVMGDDAILEDVETMRQARSILHSVLDKLMASCLLLGEKQNDGEISYVYMHDVIRDVALLIASEEGNGFFIKSGAGLKSWPNMSLLHRSVSGNCMRLSLIRNDISSLPNEAPHFPHLLSLSLKENMSLKKIPENFFQEMKALTTLDLSKTGIQSLPSSLSCLVNLYTLCLDNCIFDSSVDISVIGDLKELRWLSLENCNLLRFPEEIGGLINLKFLNLSKNNSLTVMPPNVMSNLICLEELYMRSSFDGWEVEGLEKNGNNANLEEVASLPCLTTLHLNVSRDEWNYAVQQVLQFEVSFGRESEHDDPIRFDPKRNQFSCLLTVSSPVSSSIKVLLQKVDSLVLRDCGAFTSVENLVETSKTARLDNLKSLFVDTCRNIEYLMGSPIKVNGTIPVETAFPNLKYLFLNNMPGLTEIVHGQKSVRCLDNLKLLKVKYCSGILSIFDRHLVKSVINLEELHLDSLFCLQEVINGNLSIEELGNTEEFQEKFLLRNAGLPNLRKMSLKNLAQLKTIWRGHIPLDSFANLKVVTILQCHKLRHMFSLELARSLQKLEELLISNCRQMVTLLDHDFPTTTSSPIFPSLKRLFIKECHSLQYLFSSTKDVGGLSRLEELDIWDCKNLENVIRAEEAKDVNVLRFPKLSTLRLTKLPELSDFHTGSLQFDFPSLQNVTIVYCWYLKKLPLTRSNAKNLIKIVGDSMKWFEDFTWVEDKPEYSSKLEDLRAKATQEEQYPWEREDLRSCFEETPQYFGSHGLVKRPDATEHNLYFASRGKVRKSK